MQGVQKNVLAHVMGKGKPRPGEGRNEAPADQSDLIMMVQDLIGNGPNGMSQLGNLIGDDYWNSREANDDEQTDQLVLDYIRNNSPEFQELIAQHAGVSTDPEVGGYDWRDVGPQQVPPELLRILGGASQPPSTEQRVLQQVGRDANAGPIQAGPTPVSAENPSRLEDPVFQQAMQAWIQAAGREPASDGDFQEIEDMVWQMSQGSRR